MSFRYIVGAAVLAASLPQLALSATCLPYAPTSFPATGTCVSVSAVTISGSVATVGVPSPPLGGPSSGPSASSVLAGGVGVEAKASASASGGLVRLTAFASDGGGDATSSASDRAAAGFSDLGPILLPGALPGAPIHGMVTMEIDGTHTGYAGLGSAYPHLNVAWTTAAGDFGGSFYNIDRPENGGYEFELVRWRQHLRVAGSRGVRRCRARSSLRVRRLRQHGPAVHRLRVSGCVRQRRQRP